MKFFVFLLSVAGFTQLKSTGICLASTGANQRYLKITQKGDSLRVFYLSLNVENGWIAGFHVNWETGVADKPDAKSGNHTHCSAFVAAACKRLGLYILDRPSINRSCWPMRSTTG